MSTVDQVIERETDEAGSHQVREDRAADPHPHGPPSVGGGPANADFSPDPMRRTDRYRLVTPYTLRL